MSKYMLLEKCLYFDHHRFGTDLYGAFESEKHIQTFVLCELSLGDATVPVSQLLGSDGELRVHLCHLPIKCTPFLWFGTLRRSHTK